MIILFVAGLFDMFEDNGMKATTYWSMETKTK